MSKLSKILNYIIVVALFFLIAKSIYDTNKVNEDTLQPVYELDLSLNDVISYYPDADSISSEDISLFYIFDGNDVIGKVMNTSPYCDKIYGYNGAVPLNIFLNNNDEIIDIVVCQNKETRSFMNKVISSGLLDSWDGLKPQAAIEKEVDAVSGCTFTSWAILQSVPTRMSVFADQENKHFSWDWSLFARQFFIIITTILALICFFNTKKTKALRTLVLILSIIILGFWTNTLLSLALFYNWLTNGVSWLIQIPFLVIAFLAIILPLITKKSFYCQYLCPFGAMQEFVGKIRSKKIIISSKVFKLINVARRFILLILLAAAAFGAGLDLSSVEPFPIFNYQSISFGLAIFASIILIFSIFFNKPWCSFLCPTGTLLEVFRRLRNND